MSSCWKSIVAPLTSSKLPPSMTTLAPSLSNILSSSSKAVSSILNTYLNPEQPPPSTAKRSFIFSLDDPCCSCLILFAQALVTITVSSKEDGLADDENRGAFDVTEIRETERSCRANFLPLVANIHKERRSRRYTKYDEFPLCSVTRTLYILK